jgi:aryl-alcohol dehydrogenase-like predicted oxidoreductase
MEYRELGNSQVRVSALSLGSWMTYEFMSEDEAVRVIRAAVEGGINFLDDARYNDRTGHAPIPTGYSEVLFGRLLRRGGWKREELVLANKLWYEFYPDQTPQQELDASLGRLQLDYLDLAYVEKPRELAMNELVQQMGFLLDSGKLMHWGVLNWSNTEIAEAHGIAVSQGIEPPCAAQLRYSILTRSPVEDPDTERTLRHSGIGVVASYALRGGMLTGKYNRAEHQDTIRFKAADVKSLRDMGLMDQIVKIAQLAADLNCTPAQLAIAYCLKNELVSSVLFGATSVEQVKDNLQALQVLPRLSAETMVALRQIG